MVKRHLYWAFYKSTITFNFGFSFILALVAPAMSMQFLPGGVIADRFPAAFCRIFAISIMTVGPLIAFAYKELAHPSEYYFYYNQGISKIKLYACCLIINILPATAIFIIRYYVASA